MAGKYFEDLELGGTLKHNVGRTLTEMDNVLFSSLTLNTQPLHLNEDFASKTEFKRRIVNGILTLGVAVGVTVSDLTEGTLIANLGFETVKHPHPMFHGDTLYTESTVLEKNESKTKDDRGVVRVRTNVFNQHNELVTTFERAVLVPRKS